MHDDAIDQGHKFEFQVKPLVQDGTGQCACISCYIKWFMWRGSSGIPLENMKSSRSGPLALCMFTVPLVQVANFGADNWNVVC
jgi:hypothetical protein